jgi:quinoprotein glucose dehydrogenase
MFSVSPAFVAVVFVTGAAIGQQGMMSGEWSNYSGGKGSTKYSSLDQINLDNFEDLEIAWRWRSPDNDTEKGAPPGNKVTPLMVNGRMYTATMYGMACAIDPATGKTLWVFDPEVWKGRRPGNMGFNARGLAYWTDGQGDERIILGTQHNYMYAIDAKTGKLIDDFGEKGVVDLNAGYRRPVPRSAVWAVSPANICRDTIVFGRAVNDGPVAKEAPPGDVFAFDVRTGALKWTFHNPPLPDDPGAATWEEGSVEYSGNSNVWTHMSADEALGLVYLPFGTPTNDWYGGHRKGDNLYAECLVAVDVDTGKRVWHFQALRHGLWDYDLPTAPALVDITVNGRDIKALAQMTKQGFLWVLDRTNGEPVWPIEEREVPQSNVPGEQTAKTQPFPTKPAPYSLQGSTPDQVIDFTPELKAKALAILEDFHTGPLYTPPSTDKPTLFNPGWGGGGRWAGCSVDPETGIVYIPSASGEAIAVTMVKPDGARSNFRYVSRQTRAPTGPEGLPLWKPPYSRVTAIDLNTGEHAWQVPLGRGPTDHPLLKHLNLGPLGDGGVGYPLATKTMLIVAGRQAMFWAIDKKTGEARGQIQLDRSASGTPMTYAINGKQYIVYATGGEYVPSELIALSLP